MMDIIYIGSDGKMNENEQFTNEEFRPFFQIWTKPRQTVRTAIQREPMNLVIALVLISAALEGFVNLFDSDLDIPLTATYIAIFIVASMGIGYLGWYIMAWLYKIVGSWFGGVGTAREMRIGIGMALIPAVFSAIIAFTAFIILYSGAETGIIAVLALFLAALQMVLAIWSVVIQIMMIAEVHKFSGWLGLGTIIICAVFIGIIVFVIALFILMFMGIFLL